jgi:hypothetical protein
MGNGKPIVLILMEVILVARARQLPSGRFRKALGISIMFELSGYVF